MQKEKVLFGKDEHEIEVKPITLIYTQCFEESTYLERIMITPEMSLEYFRGMKSIDPFTAKFFSVVVPDFSMPIEKENLDKCQIGFQQVIGMIGFSLNCMLQGKQFGWKYPEANLHPKYQLNLGDLLIIFSNSKLFVEILEEIREKTPMQIFELKSTQEEIDKAKERLKNLEIHS